MDSPENNTGKSPRSLQGPRPSPLRLHKDSHKIRKPPVAPPPHHHHQPPPHHHHHHQPPPHHRPPVIIYTVSPKVIHTNPNEFMTLVQRLTGPSAPSPVGPSFSAAGASVDGGAMSPAARFASIEKAVKSPEGRKPVPAGDVAAVEGVEMSYFPGILSPAPGSLPPVPANYFSPVGNDFFSGLISPGLHGNNNFVASPTNLLSSRIVSPTTPNFDLLHSLLFDM